MKVLFAVVDGGGNLPPQLAVAPALRGRGAEVRFLGHRGVRDRVQDAGFPFETFATGTDFNPTTQRPLLTIMSDMTGYAAAAARLGEHIRQRDGAEEAADAINQFTKTSAAH